MRPTDTQIDEWLDMAGWFPGRDVGVDNCGIEALAKDGYRVPDPIVGILREFNHLDFGQVYQLGALQIDAERATSGQFQEWVYVHSRNLGLEMVPIGTQSLITLLCDARGDYWAIMEEDYEKVGSDFRSVLSFFGETTPGPLRLTVPHEFVDRAFAGFDLHWWQDGPREHDVPLT